MASPHYQAPEGLAASLAPVPLTPIPTEISSSAVANDPTVWQVNHHFGGITRPRRRERDGVTVYEARRRLAGRQTALILHVPTTGTGSEPPIPVQLETGFGTEPTDYHDLGIELAQRGYTMATSQPEGIGNLAKALSYKREISGAYAEYLSQTLGLGSLVLAGYSMGGDVAAHGASQLAAHYPAALKMLVSICSVGYQEGQNIFALAGRGLPNTLRKEIIPGSRHNPMMAVRFTDNFRRHGLRLLAEGIEIGLDGCKATALSRGLEQNGFIVEHLVAASDAFCSPQDRRRTIEASRQHSIGPRTTHLAPIDQPAMTADALDEVINAHYPRGRWLRPSLLTR